MGSSEMREESTAVGRGHNAEIPHKRAEKFGVLLWWQREMGVSLDLSEYVAGHR